MVSLLSSIAFIDSHCPHINPRLLGLPDQAICNWLHHASKPTWTLGSPKNIPHIFSGLLYYITPGGVISVVWLDCTCPALFGSAFCPCRPCQVLHKILPDLQLKVACGFRETSCVIPHSYLSVVIFAPLTWNTGSIMNKLLYTGCSLLL